MIFKPDEYAIVAIDDFVADLVLGDAQNSRGFHQSLLDGFGADYYRGFGVGGD